MTEQKETKETKKKVGTRPYRGLRVEFHRGASMSADAYLQAWAVDENAPLYRAILELLNRAEDELWDFNMTANISREARADIGLQAAVMREIRFRVVAARHDGIRNLQQN